MKRDKNMAIHIVTWKRHFSNISFFPFLQRKVISIYFYLFFKYSLPPSHNTSPNTLLLLLWAGRGSGPPGYLPTPDVQVFHGHSLSLWSIPNVCISSRQWMGCFPTVWLVFLLVHRRQPPKARFPQCCKSKLRMPLWVLCTSLIPGLVASFSVHFSTCKHPVRPAQHIEDSSFFPLYCFWLL